MLSELSKHCFVWVKNSNFPDFNQLSMPRIDLFSLSVHCVLLLLMGNKYAIQTINTVLVLFNVAWWINVASLVQVARELIIALTLLLVTTQNKHHKVMKETV